jgi:asparagine synthase (glutamine-hydrolysing)
MISVYFSWTKRSLGEEFGHRFGGALEAGHKLGAQWRIYGSAIVAETTHQKNWRPTQTPRGELVLFDGYIDNRAELRSTLTGELLGDDDLYAAAYSVWGQDADLKVIGQFATIIFHPDERQVRLSRSPLFAPPLHIWNDTERLIVSSTPRSVFATGEIQQEIDEQKIADSLFLNYKEEERGWFKGVRRLPVGAHAIATRGDIRVSRYYDLHSLPETRLTSDEDYVEATNNLFEQATRAALSGFSKPAATLSGGYDSQAVTAYAARELKGRPLLALTAVPETGWDRRIDKTRFGDESSHAEALAEMYPSIEIMPISADGLYFDHKLSAMFMLASAPPRNASNLHWMHDLWSRAKTSGCDVILTGQMGNATFSFAGDGALSSWLLNGEWSKLLREFKATRGRFAQLRSFTSQTIMPSLPKNLWITIQRLRHGPLQDPYTSWCPLNPTYAAEMRVEERGREMGFDSHYQPFRSTRAWRVAVLSNAVREFGDIMQGFELIHGIPSRDPTAYRPLVEFCLGIPDDQYVRNGQRRWLARRMLKGKVPDMVLDEKRKGLQSADWHLRMGRQLGSIKEEVDRLAQDPSMAHRLNLSSLKKSLDEWPSETPLNTSLSMRLLLAVSRGLTTARFIHYIEGKNEH